MRPEPYFSTRETTSDRPRLFLVSYHFPPRNSAGALRWRKLAHYLHDVGWDLDVLTTPPGPPPANDAGLADLPPGVELYAVPDGPGRLRRLEDRLAEWIRRRGARGGDGAPDRVAIPGGESSESDLMIPWDRMSWTPRSLRDIVRAYHALLHHEETLTWARSAERVGNLLATRHRYRGIIASAPPWSTLVAAGQLSSSHSVPLVLDFRDPWTLPRPLVTESDAHPVGPLLAERREAVAVHRAAAVIMNTPTAERAMARKYPSARVLTLLNGVDDSFHDEGPRPEDPFRIVYAGTIYIDRDPRTLLAAVGTVVRDLSIPQGALEVEFIGNAETFMGMPTEKLARDAGIEACFRLIPAMPRSQLLEHLKRAAVLVSLPQSTPWSMPSKVYEYMGFSARLLVYAEPGTATAEVLADSDAVVLRPDDLEGTVEALKRCYAEHRDGVTERRAGNAREFARSQGGRQLQGLLLELGWTVDGVATVGQGSLDLV